MFKIQEELKKYPISLSIDIEKNKFNEFESALTYVLNKTDIIDEFNNMSKNDKLSAMEFLKILYSFGYYSGVGFTLENINKYQEDKDIFSDL